MLKLAASTKILLAVMISACSLVMADPALLLALLLLELLAACRAPQRKLAAKAILLLLLFALLLLAIQLLCGTLYPAALVSALRMAIMAISIVLMLFFTRTQQLTAALVRQFHLPYSYAFMVTAVLRFVPDLLEESRSVREAQACRGYKAKGNPLQRIRGYMAVIKPLLFRAIERSDHMAVSLEMRGFSESRQRTFVAETNLKAIDYMALCIGGLVVLFAVKGI